MLLEGERLHVGDHVDRRTRLNTGKRVEGARVARHHLRDVVRDAGPTPSRCCWPPSLRHHDLRLTTSDQAMKLRTASDDGDVGEDVETPPETSASPDFVTSIDRS